LRKRLFNLKRVPEKKKGGVLPRRAVASWRGGTFT